MIQPPRRAPRALILTMTALALVSPAFSARDSASGHIPKPPMISSFTPSSGSPGTSVTITGSAFQNTSSVTFNVTSAITFSVVSGSQISASVPPGASTGPILVTTRGGTATSTSSFTVTSAPTLTGFSPSSGPVGTSVTLNGTGFTGVSGVAFKGTSAGYTVNSDSQVTATVPSGASSGPITVSTSGGTATSASNFTVIPPPAITGFSPASGPVGTTVTISGSGLTGATAVAFNGTSATYTVNSDSQVTATVPSGASSGPITVTTGGGTATSTSGFTVTASAVVAQDSFQRTQTGAWGSADVGGVWSLLDTPSNWSVTPGAGSIAVAATAQERGILTGVSVRDVDLLAQLSLPMCTGSGTNCDAFLIGRYQNSSSYYRIGLVQGQGQGTILIRSQRGDGSTVTGDVNTGITAADGVKLWLRVELRGSNPTVILARAWKVGSSEPSTWQLSASDNASAEQTAGAVGVRARNEDSGAAHSFAFYSYQATQLPPPPPPTISGFSPASGIPATTVTISGSGFNAATAVAFNGTTAAFAIVSDGQINATVPTGATSGPISVTSSGGTATSSSSFTVTAPPNRTITTSAFQVTWSPLDPEEITNLSWNGSTNLTGSWTNGTQCSGGYNGGDEEFFGNGWSLGAAGAHPVLVGLGSTGTWNSQTSGGATTVTINSAAAATAYCPQDTNIPITTTYTFPSSGNTFTMQRTFSFGQTPFSGSLRPYIPRLARLSSYPDVYYPTTSNTLAHATTSPCDAGCTYNNWNGTWYTITNALTGQGVLITRTSTGGNPNLWVDQDGGSNTNATSVLLPQPTGGFTGTLTETETLCFFTGWTPSLTTPPGC
jgi:large repetitive protein